MRVGSDGANLVKNDLTIGEIKRMSFAGFKEKLLANFQGLSKKKYFFYFLIMIISSFASWVLTKNISSAIFLVALFLFIIVIDLLFDLLGYFKNSEDTKKIPIVKKILGYIIGTIIFILAGITLLKIIDALF